MHQNDLKYKIKLIFNKKIIFLKTRIDCISKHYLNNLGCSQPFD